MSKLLEPFQSLRNHLFAKLYLAQTISLMGDAFTWVGLALLAYQFGEERAAVILATALTLRVTAFIIFSPFAGVLADRISRKKILYTTHFIRMGIVGCLPFVTEEWQIYVLVFMMNVFNAFFSPTYRSIIPQIVEKSLYRQAIGLSAATYQLLGVLGPGLAGIMAIWLGARDIFFVDAATFVIAGILLLSLPKSALDVTEKQDDDTVAHSTWQDVLKGIHLLFSNQYVRFALFIEFVTAVSGALILVNTIVLVKGGLDLTDKVYGIIMAAFAIGAMVAAFVSGAIDKSKSRRTSLIIGALILGVSISFANYLDFSMLFIVWIVAGLGQSLAEIPSETLIGETVPIEAQGKVYGSHFAFSHLWWAFAYPLAGFLGTTFPNQSFLYGGIITFVILVLVVVFLRPKKIV